MPDARDLQTQLQESLAERERLLDEIRLLRGALDRHGVPFPEPSNDPVIVHETGVPASSPSPEEKITLFRALFRGREDVYAERWEARDGQSGYMPASEKNWKALLASKPENRKKVHKKTRKLLPLTDQVLRLHLTGKKTIGIYPLLTDDTCWLLAADFDKKTWQDDAMAFLASCRRIGVPAYLERSRSGNGGHVWILFERAIPAILARKMGCAILTQTMERRHQLGLDSYDRLFPNQDTQPKGGFGNLIALPLQKAPRDNGNSVFIDDTFRAYPDQWRFLASMCRVSPDQVVKIVSDAARTGQIVGVRMSIADEESDDEPWMLPPSRKHADKPIQGPFPEQLTIVRGNLIYIPKSGLPEPMLNRIIRLAAFQNPEFYKAQAMRLPIWDKPRVISCSEDLPQYVALPRGCLDEVCQLLEGYGISVTTRDERFAGTPIEVIFHGHLHEEQLAAVARALQRDEGVLCAPTAFGKTVVASKLIAERKVNTLVLVHRQQLLDQWRERLALFLNVPPKSIGQIGGGKISRTGVIDVALIQSLQRKGVVKDFVAEYGHVIVDECHHLSAFTFEQVMKQAKARYVVGLTATPTRKDGHHPIIFMECGPMRFNLSARQVAGRSPFRHLLLPRPTDFRIAEGATDVTIQDLYSALVVDVTRNQQIIEDVLNAVRLGLTPLVLTNRTEHLECLARGLSAIENVMVLKGGMGKKQRRAIAEKLSSIPEEVSRVILATGSYIGEGFDDPRLDALFLTMPISWRGTLQQYVGRLHRVHYGKRVVKVYDYVDTQVPMLARMYDKRLKGYSAIGYAVETISGPAGTALENPGGGLVL
jgi:superfamily II DNA or RNA helicase